MLSRQGMSFFKTFAKAFFPAQHRIECFKPRDFLVGRQVRIIGDVVDRPGESIIGRHMGPEAFR